MDLSDVAVFVRVVEHGGFAPAARVLRIPKSTLSRRVASLEESLGLRLLQRTSRRQSLTEAGATFYERVRDSVATIESAGLDVAELSEEPRGRLRIASVPDLGTESFPALVAEFLRRHPKVTVELHLSANRVDLVGDGFDAAIRAGRLDDSSLVARKLIDTTLRLYASPSYLDSRGRARRIADLERHDLLSLVQMPTFTLVGPRGRTRVRPRSRMLANDMKVLHSAACASAGIALLPEMLCEREVHERILEPVLPQYAVPGGTVSFVYPSGRQADAKLRAFRDFLLERTRGMRTGLPPVERRG